MPLKATVQGDPSGSSQPPVDIKTKVAFQYMIVIPKHNFCFNVNWRLGNYLIGHPVSQNSFKPELKT